MASPVSGSPMCRPERVNNGPRRVHTAADEAMRMGWPVCSLNQTAILPGCCATNGNNWLAAAINVAANTNTTATP